MTTALEKSGVEVACNHLRERPTEAGGHATNSRANLDDGLFRQIVGAKLKGFEISENFVVTSVGELSKIKRLADFVIEDPTDFAHDIVGRFLTFADATGGAPRNELGTTPTHLRSGSGAA